MSNFSVIFIISVFCVSYILSEGDNPFCSKTRKLLLGGVFNYDRIIFAYSWIDTRNQLPVDSYLVWRFEVKKKKVVGFGKEVPVGDIFPGIPLIRGGFGLTIKCEATDMICKSYRQLVFIFFQNQFKAFRFARDHFAPETNKSKLPWALNLQGQYSDWFFGSTTLDSSAPISCITFISGYQSQIFMISRDVLYSSPVDVKATGLKWTQMAQSQDLINALGGFVVGSEIFINKKMESSEGILMKYDQNGKALEEIPVWNFFGCDPNSDISGFMAVSDEKENEPETIEEINKRYNTLATIIMAFVVILIIITNVIAAIYWFMVYRANKNLADIQ